MGALNHTGLACGTKVSIPIAARSCIRRSEAVPATPTLDRSPFTSATNTGTPMLENASAILCKVTVLPVPVAPVINPWRLAMHGSSARV